MNVSKFEASEYTHMFLSETHVYHADVNFPWNCLWPPVHCSNSRIRNRKIEDWEAVTSCPWKETTSMKKFGGHHTPHPCTPPSSVSDIQAPREWSLTIWFPYMPGIIQGPRTHFRSAMRVVRLRLSRKTDLITVVELRPRHANLWSGFPTSVLTAEPNAWAWIQWFFRILTFPVPLHH